ncbi:hypothetical protein NPIL_446111 [Nephila pilipes]|uniref:Uncharacterized protein n=1 Tax=Nephila pilipes TaxID=299642 RepID=A0A8X6U5N4_NEPPI|nr:hypothetical protein NPIL_446111 [Nephila pilipes]
MGVGYLKSLFSIPLSRGKSVINDGVKSPIYRTAIREKVRRSRYPILKTYINSATPASRISLRFRSEIIARLSTLFCTYSVKTILAAMLEGDR